MFKKNVFDFLKDKPYILYLSDKTSIYLCKNKFDKIKDIANMIRNNSSELSDMMNKLSE